MPKYSTIAPQQVFPLPPHEDVPPSPELIVERSVVIAASPERIYDLLVGAEQWPRWDPAITYVETEAHRPLETGDAFTKEEAGTDISARVLEAERGHLLRWRGLAPGRVVGIHSFRLVPLDADHTLVVDREEYSQWFLKLIAWATDLGIGAQFEKTLGALKNAAESRH